MTPARRKTTALRLYRKAEQLVHSAGFGWEPDWQRIRTNHEFTERDLLRESAWVVLCSGFRESVVRNVFDYISLCFCDWEAAEEITRRRQACIDTASWRFKNQKKLRAIVSIADLVQEQGFAAVKVHLQKDPISRLQAFPFIGPVTSWHLAKNLGFNVAKNDRHLARLATNCGYPDAHSLCKTISEATGELASVVDVVLWRFATLKDAHQAV